MMCPNEPAVWVMVTTFPERTVAETAARHLVAEGLAACAQVGADIVSFYQWRGELHQDHEIAVALKVRHDRREACASRLRELHPYRTPQLLGWPAPLADAAYLAWVYAAETQAPGTEEEA